MRKLFAVLCFLVFLAPSARSIDPWTGPTRKPPHHGMTKAAAAAYYGEPYHRVASGRDERWYYRLKYSEVYGKAWVPFEFDSDNVRLGSITFGPDGKIKGYDWKHTVAR